MKQLVAIEAELIRVRPDIASSSRRRLLIERSAEGAERIPVRVTELADEGCSIACSKDLDDVEGRFWLKFPGLEAFQISVIDEAAGHLSCVFSQPLPPIVFAALTGPAAPQIRQRAHRPRCSFLR
jgi:hypothetical protein